MPEKLSDSDIIDVIDTLRDFRGYPTSTDEFDYLFTPPKTITTYGQLCVWQRTEIDKIFRMEYYAEDLERLNNCTNKLFVRTFIARWKAYRAEVKPKLVINKDHPAVNKVLNKKRKKTSR